MSSIIPQCNPKASFGACRVEIKEAIDSVLDSGWYILGKKVAEFENAFASFLGARHGLGVASGTDAIELALRACGVKKGDHVITVSHTAVATVAAIERAGAVPVFADIEPGSNTMSPESVKELIRSSDFSYKAIIPVHLYGHPARMDELLMIAKENALFVIEDCAQAHGAMIDDKKIGTFGDIGCFSFYPTKNLGAIGDGGAIVTDQPELFQKARVLQQYGWQERYISAVPGINSRLDEIQAAILNIKLPLLGENNRSRREIARSYTNAFSSREKLTTPCERSGCYHVYHQYVIKLSQRDRFQAYLEGNGVKTAVHYPRPVHLQPAYANRISQIVSLSTTEDIARQVISLPMYPEMNALQVEKVIEIVLSALDSL